MKDETKPIRGASKSATPVRGASQNTRIAAKNSQNTVNQPAVEEEDELPIVRKRARPSAFIDDNDEQHETEQQR